MSKTQLWTRKKLRKYRLAQEAERAEQRKLDAQLARVPRKWREHTLAMRKMMEGIDDEGV